MLTIPIEAQPVETPPSNARARYCL
jgi:hypothetical protein